MLVKIPFIAGLSLASITTASSITIGLESNWTIANFAIQLIEAASQQNESLFYRSTEVLFQSSEDDNDNWDDELSDSESIHGSESTDVVNTAEWPLSNKESYDRVVRGLSPVDVGFINLNLINFLAFPRLEAHFNHFRHNVQNELLRKVQKNCEYDSFGQPIADPTSAWVKYGSRIYCSDEDLYALQLSSSYEELKPFDRVFGDNLEAPVLLFYGHPDSERFAAMFNTLAQFAKSGTIRFVWRYMPHSQETLPLYGYGSTLTISKKKSALDNDLGSLVSIEELFKKYNSSTVHEAQVEDFNDAAFKAIALIRNAPISKQLSFLAEFVNKLPLYSPFLAKSSLLISTDNVKEAAMKNERIGASSDMVGISINGATIHRLETDLPNVIKKLESEINLIGDLNALGFTTAQAKLLFYKNALRAAIKENEYNTGSKFTRFAVYQHTYDPNNKTSGGVVFFNNIESDQNYNLLSPDAREVYIEKANQIRMGQVPPLKQNVHDLIFVLNLSNRAQLRVFFTMSKIILDKGIPQQLGILPLVSNEKDQRIAAYFYHLVEVGEIEEALALLFRYYETTDENEEDVLGLVKLADSEIEKFNNHHQTLADYDLTEPSVIVNGIIHNLRSSDWQTKLVAQVAHDVQFLKKKLLDNTSGLNLRDTLHEGSWKRRNRKVVPQSPANIRYKKITRQLVDSSLSLTKSSSEDSYGPTIWLIGSIHSPFLLSQLKEALQYMKSSSRPIQIRIFDTSSTSEFHQSIKEDYLGKKLSDSELDRLVDSIKDLHTQNGISLDKEKLKILKENHIQLHHPVLLLNSRYSKIDKILLAEDLRLMVEYEFDHRLNFLQEAYTKYPESFPSKVFDLKHGYDQLTWFDLVSSVITDSIFLEDSMPRSDFGRFDFSVLNHENLIDLTGYDLSKPLDILVVVDPIDTLSPKLLGIASTLKDLPFVNLMVLMQPFSKASKFANLDRLFVSNFVSSKPRFNSDGEFSLKRVSSIKIGDIGKLKADLEAPNNWYYAKGAGSGTFDLDHLLSGNKAEANFTVTHLLVEAQAVDVQTARSIPGIIFNANSFEDRVEGVSTRLNGYCQLLLKPGVWTLELENDGGKNLLYNLLSATDNKYEPNDNPILSESVSVFTLFRHAIYPRLKHKEDSEELTPASKLQNGKQSLQGDADINVLLLSTDFKQDQFLASLIKSICEHTEKSVKFWLVDNFSSENTLGVVHDLSLVCKFQYAFVSYKWPIWLREQKDRLRQMAAFKVLFLDVIFPKSLEKVVVLDVDLYVLGDLDELIREDLHDSVYGLVPMCEDRPKSAKFWHSGYWKNILGEDLKYYLSSLIVVDLKAFRDAGAGEDLRRQYQKLSSDPNSLVLLDQDLLNNLQRVLPIHAFSADWSWNPTWCSEKLKEKAKTIHFDIGKLPATKAFQKSKEILPRWLPILKSGDKKSKAPTLDHDEF